MWNNKMHHKKWFGTYHKVYIRGGNEREKKLSPQITKTLADYNVHIFMIHTQSRTVDESLFDIKKYYYLTVGTFGHT